MCADAFAKIHKTSVTLLPGKGTEFLDGGLRGGITVLSPAIQRASFQFITSLKESRKPWDTVLDLGNGTFC